MAKRKGPSGAGSRRPTNEISAADAAGLRRRRAAIRMSVIGSIIAVVVIAIVVLVTTNRTSSEVVQPSAEATVSVQGAGGIAFDVSADRVRVGAVDAAVTLSLYEDFSCIHCQEYEASIGDTLEKMIASGDVAVEYHPIHFVTDYGRRAGSAATCVAVGAPDSWLDVHAALFAQHDAATDGWNNAQFRDYLAAEGIGDDAMLTCVEEGRYEGWIDQNTQVARDAGVTGTPTLRINGETVEDLDSAALQAEVDRLVAAG